MRLIFRGRRETEEGTRDGPTREEGQILKTGFLWGKG